MKLNISKVALIIVVRQLLDDFGDDDNNKINQQKRRRDEATRLYHRCFALKIENCGLNLEVCQFYDLTVNTITKITCVAEVGVFPPYFCTNKVQACVGCGVPAVEGE